MRSSPVGEMETKCGRVSRFSLAGSLIFAPQREQNLAPGRCAVEQTEQSSSSSGSGIKAPHFAQRMPAVPLAPHVILTSLMLALMLVHIIQVIYFLAR